MAEIESGEPWDTEQGSGDDALTDRLQAAAAAAQNGTSPGLGDYLLVTKDDPTSGTNMAWVEADAIEVSGTTITMEDYTDDWGAWLPTVSEGGLYAVDVSVAIGTPSAGGFVNIWPLTPDFAPQGRHLPENYDNVIRRAFPGEVGTVGAVLRLEAGDVIDVHLNNLDPEFISWVVRRLA